MKLLIKNDDEPSSKIEIAARHQLWSFATAVAVSLWSLITVAYMEAITGHIASCPWLSPCRRGLYAMAMIICLDRLSVRSSVVFRVAAATNGVPFSSYLTLNNRDLKIWVIGHWRSFTLVPFESVCAVSYSPSIITMALSCIISEIKRDIDRKSWFFIHSTPPLEGPRRSISIPFGV